MKKGIVLFIVCLLFLCCSCKSKGQHRIEVIVERNQAGNTSCLDFIDDNPRVSFNYTLKDKAAEPEKRVSFLGQTLQGHYNKSCKIVDSMIDFYQTDEKEGGLEFSVDRKTGTVCNYWNGEHANDETPVTDNVKTLDECETIARSIMKETTGLDIDALVSASEISGSYGNPWYHYCFEVTVGNILCCEIDMTFYTNGELLAYSNYQEYNKARHEVICKLSEEKAVRLADNKVAELLSRQNNSIETKRNDTILYYSSPEGKGWLSISYECYESGGASSDRLTILIPIELL